MKDRKAIYADDHTAYFPYAEGSTVLKIIIIMIDIFYLCIAAECAVGGAIILCAVLISVAVSTDILIIMIMLWMEQEKITVSYNGVIFENERTGKAKSFAWSDVAAIEYIGYENYKTRHGYKIYLKKEYAEEADVIRSPDYFIPDTGVERSKIAVFMPRGMNIISK